MGAQASPLLNLQGPLRCAHCQSMEFNPHVRKIGNRVRVVRLESSCGLVYQVDENGFVESAKQPRLINLRT